MPCAVVFCRRHTGNHKSFLRRGCSTQETATMQTSSFTGRPVRPLVRPLHATRMHRRGPCLRILNIASSQLPRSNNNGATPHNKVVGCNFPRVGMIECMSTLCHNNTHLDLTQTGHCRAVCGIVRGRDQAGLTIRRRQQTKALL